MPRDPVLIGLGVMRQLNSTTAWAHSPLGPGRRLLSVGSPTNSDGHERMELATVHRVLVAAGRTEIVCWENDANPNARPNYARIRNTHRGVWVKAEVATAGRVRRQFGGACA